MQSSQQEKPDGGGGQWSISIAKSGIGSLQDLNVTPFLQLHLSWHINNATSDSDGSIRISKPIALPSMNLASPLFKTSPLATATWDDNAFCSLVVYYVKYSFIGGKSLCT